MLIHNKDDIQFVTEFPCFLGHPVPYSPTRLLSSILPGGLSRTGGISIIVYRKVYLGLEVYLLLSTWRSIQDWRSIYYCLPGGLSRTGGLSIIVYLEVCLGLEFYLLLSTCRSIQYWCSIYYCLPGCLSWTGGISVIVYLEVYLGLVFYLGMTFQTVSSSWLGFLQFYSQLNYSVSLLIILLHVNRRTFNDFELRRLTTYCRF